MPIKFGRSSGAVSNTGGPRREAGRVYGGHPAFAFEASTVLVGIQCRGWSGLWLRISRFILSVARTGQGAARKSRLALSNVKPVCNDLLDEPAAPMPVGALARLNGGLFGITREMHG